MAFGHTRMFVKQLIRSPGTTGALLPSSDRLAREMVRLAAPPPGAVIAELGPGTGSFTRRIVESLQPGQKFFAVEINENFARLLKRHMPGLRLHIGCGSELARFCREEGESHVDCVISGLPWAVIPDQTQDAILDAMISVMPPGGIFATFAYVHALVLPGARKFKKKMLKRFSDLEVSGIVWKNVPPAIVYRCRK